MSKKDKTPDDVKNLTDYAQKNPGSTNKYLNKNNYKGAKTIEELVEALQKIKLAKASTSKTPTIGTPVIQSEKKTRI